MEEKLTVKTRDGQTWEIYVIMEFQVENYPDDYIAYTFGEKNGENVTSFISKMKEDNNTIILDSIQDPKEWTNVKRTFDELLKNGGELEC
ncbi:MAG: DUF1292 domain-containing protein [Erysipelotrichaceae bacterium]|nr:DUF1292 domain-containing protein [Erysipelotrichaceae bacterium]